MTASTARRPRGTVEPDYEPIAYTPRGPAGACALLPAPHHRRPGPVEYSRIGAKSGGAQVPGPAHRGVAKKLCLLVEVLRGALICGVALERGAERGAE